MGRGSGAGKVLFLCGQLFLKHAHLAEDVECFQRLFRIDFGDGKADVHDGVIAYRDVGHVVQAHLFDDAAEVNAADAEVVFKQDFVDAAWNSETHGNSVYTARGQRAM